MSGAHPEFPILIAGQFPGDAAATGPGATLRWTVSVQSPEQDQTGDCSSPRGHGDPSGVTGPGGSEEPCQACSPAFCGGDSGRVCLLKGSLAEGAPAGGRQPPCDPHPALCAGVLGQAACWVRRGHRASTEVSADAQEVLLPLSTSDPAFAAEGLETCS